MDPAREKELDEYEERYGKYVVERGSFGAPTLRVGVQSFAFYWDDDPSMTNDENDQHRRWYKRMVCCALHHLVEAEKPQ